MTASAEHRTARWQAYRKRILLRDLWTCQMCDALLTEGRTSPRSAVVDHVQPAELRPDLFYDETNARAVCRDCHAICDSIEKRHSGNAEAIAKAKREWRQQFTPDGRLVW